MLKLDVKVKLLILQIILKFILLEKVITIKEALGNRQNQQILELVPCYLASLSRFLMKTTIISLGTQCLHSLFAQSLSF